MTNGEIQARGTLKQWLNKNTEEQMVKKLGEEVVELAIAIERKDERNIREEIGDCALILVHILTKHDPKNIGIIDPILAASEKLERRMHKQQKQHS